MTRTRIAWLAIAGLTGTATLLDLRPDAARAAAPDHRCVDAGTRSPPATLPLVFEANRGQTDARVRFVTRAANVTAFVTPAETVFTLHSPSAAPGGASGGSGTDVVRMCFVGANEAPAVEGTGDLPGRSSYFIGSDPSKWIAGVPQFAGVALREVYPGIDVRWHGDAHGRLTYDVVAAPGADVASISIALDGARGLTIADDGTLCAATERGELRQTRPVAFQMVDGVRRTIDAAFALTPDRRVRFRLGAYDERRTLVIDPSVAFATYMGGSGAEVALRANGIAVDGSGAAYVMARTTSLDFPTQSPFQGTNAGNDVFVAKIDTTTPGLVYSTYLGGALMDMPGGLAVDGSGAAYLTGYTGSTDFPTQSPMQASNAGQWDAFLVKLAASGQSLVYSTYIGGASSDEGSGVAVDGSGAAYVCGDAGVGFPVTSSAVQTSHATGSVDSDAFVVKVNASGSGFVYSTYLGGVNNDAAIDIEVDSSGDAFVVGATYSPDFPTLSALQGAIASGMDVFVSKLNPTGSALAYSTFLGGAGTDDPYGIAIDSSGAAYVTGDTNSADFPTLSPLQSVKYGADDGFVAKIAPSGSSLVYSTYLGGSDLDYCNGGIAVDGAGCAIVVGNTRSYDFPLAAPTQSGRAGISDAMLTKFNASGSALLYSTLLGGSANDLAKAVAVDAAGDAYVLGLTTSPNFPVQSAVQGSFAGAQDAFVAKIRIGSVVDPPPAPPPAAPIDLVADYDEKTGVTLAWTDAAADEAGFRVERHSEGYAFGLLTTTEADVTGAIDTALFAGTTYTYRVRAFNAAGNSAWSNEASITTSAVAPPPALPKAPTNLVATAGADFEGGPVVDLSWTDNSNDETLFGLERAMGGGRYELAGTTRADVTQFEDADLHPGWPATYRVRALALQGPSPYSNTAGATIPATLDVAAVAGSLTDSAKSRRDKVKLAATYASTNGDIDLVADGIDLELGPAAAPVPVSIPPADGAWKVKTKKGAPVKATWKSAKGESPKVKVVVDMVRHVLTTTVSGFDFSAAPTPSMRTLLACGPDGGAHVSTWTEKKPGVFRLP